MNNEIKNLLNKKKLLLASLAMSSTIALSGCQTNYYSHYYIGNSKIEYHTNNEETKIVGKIKYENLDKIRVLVFKKDDNIYIRLVFVSQSITKGGLAQRLTVYDIESEVKLLEKVTNNSNQEKYEVGKDIEILQEDCITKYLLVDDNFKKEYDINEIIELFNTGVKPSLEEKYQVKKR